MPTSTYVARLPGPFAALVQAPEIGGFRLEPLLSTRVRDRFFDTDDGALLRAGLAVRVREQDGAVTAGLQALDETAPGALPRDLALRVAPADGLDLEGSPFAPAVREAAGTTRLRTLLSLRQHRTPRVVSAEGGRHLALVSFDVVAYEVPDRHVVTNEVEVERAGEGTDLDLERLDAALRENGMEPAVRTKLERGVLLMPRPLSEPLLLLPDEARRLAAAADGDDPLLARRARVVLLDARGYRADTIALRTGLSAARANHWKALFREQRMAMFNGGPPSVPVGTPAAPARSDPPRARPTAVGEARPVLPPDPMTWTQDAAAAHPPSPTAPTGRGGSNGDRPAPPGGDGAAEAPSAPQDMEDFLDLFRSVETATPLLDDDGEAVRDVPRPAPPPPGGAASEPGVLRQGGPPPPAGPVEVADESPGVEPVPLRPPHLSGDTPVIEGAARTIAFHVARYDRAARTFAEGGGVGEAVRAVEAARSVRLAVLAFRWLVPRRAADRLVEDLRPAVVALDAALDYDRAASAAGDRAGRFRAARRRALAAAQDVLADRHGAWRGRAERLVARLDAQGAAAIAVGDDVDPPPPDFVGPGGHAPVPSRLRHVLGSMLWHRYEAVRAFEGGAAERPETAEHFASALRALRFTLGLAAGASDGPSRELAAALAAAEGRVTAERDRRRTAGLLGTAAPPPSAVRTEWRALDARTVRRRLAAVAAGL